MTRRTLGGALLCALAAHAPATAQSLGTFSWQLQPYCNVITVSVAQQGPGYTVDGYDDQCGAPQRAPLVGLATPNPDGTIGLGLHVVTMPSGRGLDIAARITLATLGGPWSDSSGNAGTFAFGAATGGSPRPLPTIPAAMIAPGAVGAAQINPSQVQARVTGGCTNGQALRGVNPDGTVACTDSAVTADDPVNAVGLYASLAIGRDGMPVIAHQDATASTLRVTHCGDSACVSGNVSTTVYDPVGAAGQFASIGIGGDGFPVVAHRDGSNSTVLVTHCGNATCTNGNATTVADNGYFGGATPALAIGPNGLPAIAHRDLTASGLRITSCTVADCSTANSVTIDTPAGGAGANAAIAAGSDGRFVIAHRASVNGSGALRITHCGNAPCTGTGNVSTTIDAPAGLDVAQQIAIAVPADGRPVVAHTDTSSTSLRVTRCANPACTSATTEVLAVPVGVNSTALSMSIGTDGLPLIAYGAATAEAPAVVHCGTLSCSAGNSTTLLDDSNTPGGSYVSMRVGADGLPVVAHAQPGPGVLRVVRCGTATCQ
jgi:hypothetical protein